MRKADTTPIIDITDIDVGLYFACAVTGSHGAYCWGNNYSGQLGIGAIDVGGDATAPVTHSAFALPVVTTTGGSTPFVGADQISVGTDHACAHKTDNTIWCWGFNGAGQLGNAGVTGNSTVPVQVIDLANRASQVAVSDEYACARTGDEAWCWGGDIVFGSGAESNSPVQVMSTPSTAFNGISDLRATYKFVCALKSADKSVWCWTYFADMSSRIPVPAMGPATPENPAGLPVSGVSYWDLLGGPWYEMTAPRLCLAGNDGVLSIANVSADPISCP